jgi:thiamine pyrophosphokinase
MRAAGRNRAGSGRAPLMRIGSLLAVGGPALGVQTSGLRFPLHNETLHPGSTRGLSNEFLELDARVSLDNGVLLVVLPNARKAF